MFATLISTVIRLDEHRDSLADVLCLYFITARKSGADHSRGSSRHAMLGVSDEKYNWRLRSALGTELRKESEDAKYGVIVLDEP
jgi:hypothetical protein